MNTAIKKMNTYFFGEENITLSDALWFYGMISLCTVLALTSCVPAIIQLLTI